MTDAASLNLVLILLLIGVPVLFMMVTIRCFRNTGLKPARNVSSQLLSRPGYVLS